MRFAVQLYSLRELAQREGAESVFRTVAQAGYDGVEFAGFYDLTPLQMKEMCARYGLRPVSAHIGVDSIASSKEYIEALGIEKVFIPWIGKETYDDPAAYASVCKAIEQARAALPNDVQLGYHNHAHEFEGGRDRLAKLLRDLPFLSAELDVFWVTVAGLDAVKYMESLQDRLSFVHIKEAAAEHPAESAQPIVGEGAIDMRGVFSHMRERKTDWAVLEVESYPCGEAEYLCRSLENMKKLAKD